MERRDGRGRPGAPKSQEQGLGQGEGKERQPLPNAWDVLERHVRLHAPDLKDRPRIGSKEFKREIYELDRLDNELEKKGTGYDQLVYTLYYTRIAPPVGLSFELRYLTLEESREFRSQFEQMSENQIREEVHKAEKEREHQWEEYHKANPDPFKGDVFC